MALAFLDEVVDLVAGSDSLLQVDLKGLATLSPAQVARLVTEGGETPTAAQALEILRLLAERSRIAAQRDGTTSNNPRDY